MRNSSLILLLGLALSPALALAASVSQVKGNKMMIQLDGLQVAQGSELYLLNADGKKVGLVAVRQVKGDRALAELTKGRAEAGMSVQMKGAASSGSAASHTADTSSSDSGKSARQAPRKGKHVGGVLAGYSMTNMSLTVQRTSGGTKEDITMKDSGFSLKGFYDYDVSPTFTIRFASGLESFAAKGTLQNALCDGSTACEVNFNYLAFEASGHYNLTQGTFKSWVGLGYSFLLAASKKNNIPNLSSDNSTNQMILISGGADYWMSKNSFIPVVLEYGMFPGSTNVKADGIFIRGGYGFTF